MLVINPPSERSEHLRRLKDWSFCPSLRVSVYTITDNSNDVIAPTVQAATPARDVQILKFLSPRQSADFDQGSAVSPHPQQERNTGSASICVRTG